ncbi:MAG: hypothetical protein KA171_17745 [Reyranella sp.]|nr:hypothetical protein [Reyranella sp.]
MAIIPNTPANTHLEGTDFNDTFTLITGGSGDNNGHDTYDGKDGRDTILGGWAADVLHVTNNLANLVSIAELDGGDDTLNRNTILATTGNDTLNFSNYVIRNFVIDGGKGNDVITGSLDSANQIRGGEGNDTLKGGNLDDIFYLITGGDTNGVDQYDGGAGYNRIVGGGSYDVLRVTKTMGNLVNIQEIDGGDGQIAYNTILATADHDTLDFSGMIVNHFRIDGAGGGDKITGSAQKNVLIGNTGDDRMNGAGGSDDYLVGLGHGADIFNDTGPASDTDRILATASGVSIGIAGSILDPGIAGIEEISANGKVSVNVVGTGNHQTLDFSNVAFTGIGVVDALGGDDVISTSNHTVGQAYRGGIGNDAFVLGSADSKLLVSGASHGFDLFSGNTPGAEHRIVAETAGTQIGIGHSNANPYGGTNSVDIIDGNGKANVTVVGWSGTHDNWDLSGTKLIGIKEVATAGGNDTIWTSNDSNAVDGQAYRGGVGHDTFRLGSQDTRLLVSAADNSGFDIFAGNTDGADHTVIVEDANTQVGISTDYGGAKSVDVIDATGKANASIVGSSGSHDLWDLSGTELRNIATVSVGGGNDKVQTALASGNHITYDGGAGGSDKLTISLTAAQAGNATLLAQIAALVPGAGLNGTLNAAGVQLTAQGWESFAVAVEVGGSFQPLNILFGTANHQNGVHTPVLSVPLAKIGESWAIFGLGGDDIITGGDNADFIDGGAGTDTMNGGGGDDTFVANNPTSVYGDAYNGGSGYDTIVSGDGADILVNALTAIEEISGNGFAGVRLVGSNSTHVTLNLSNVKLTGIAEVYGGAANNIIHTSNVTADQAYRGGKGNDEFHFGDEDTILLASSADNGGNDSFFDNTAGAEHIIRAEDAGTQIGIGASYVGAKSVDVIDADGHANVAILGSSSSHDTWDFSGTDLIGIARIETLGGNDTITVSSSMDPATGIILDGGAHNDTLVLRLTNAEYLAAQTEIDDLVLNDGGVVNSGAFNFTAVNFENVTLDFI